MKLKPSYVIINSRIEDETGIKDSDKIMEFLKIVSLGDLK